MKLLKSKKGFTLIELLVVIGILAVLAAIAIPSVAGLIDRANVSADKTNANEMTNAIERFASEYELYCQDIASGALVDANNDGTPDNMDAAQGRVFNVTKVKDRAGIEGIEKPQTATAAGTTGIAIYRDTKYPVNAETMQAIVKNYTKTSSATFDPKQSDMHYYYSPDCGVVVVAPAGLTASSDLNKYVQSGMDAKGNELGDDTAWVDLTSQTALGSGAGTPETTAVIPEGGVYRVFDGYKILRDCDDCGKQAVSDETACLDCGCTIFMERQIAKHIEYHAGDNFPTPQPGDTYIFDGRHYCYKYAFCHGYSCWGYMCLCGEGMHSTIGWTFTGGLGDTNRGGELLSYIGNEPLLSMHHAYVDTNIHVLPTIPDTVVDMRAAFCSCAMWVKPQIPSSVTTPEEEIFSMVTFH